VIELIMNHDKVKDYKKQFLDNLSLVTLKHIPDEIGPTAWSDFEIGLGILRDWEQFLSEYELSGLAKRVAKTAKLMKLRG